MIREGRGHSLLDLLASQGIGLAASVLVTFSTARLLGPSARGELAFIFTTGNLLGAIGFGSLHVGTSLQHRRGHGNALALGKSLAILSSVAVTAIGLILALAALLSGDAWQASRLAVAGFAGGIACFNLFVLRTRQALGHARVFRNGWAIQSIVYFVGGTVAAAFTGSAFTVSACWMLGLVASTSYALRNYNSEPTRRAGVALTPMGIARPSWAAHSGFLGLQLLYRTNPVVLGFTVRPAELGLYSVAAPLAELTWVISEGLSLAAFSSTQSSRSYGVYAQQRRRLVSMAAAAGLVSSAGVGVGAAILIPRLLPDYSPAVPLVWILLPGVTCQGVARIWYSSLAASGSGRESIVVGALSCLLTLTYLPAAALGGLTAATVTVSSAYTVHAFILGLLARRRDRALSENWIN